MIGQTEVEADIDADLSAGVISGGRPRSGRLRGFLATYPKPVWILAIANTILWTGRGMVMPYLFIYFSEIVGLPGSVVGGGIAISALVASAFVILVAPQIDRRGARPVLLVSILGLAALTIAYPWATTIPIYLVVTCIFFMFDQLYWPAVNSATVPLTHPSLMAESLALMRCAFIAGIGLGSLLGGFMVTGGGLREYRVMYMVSAGVLLLATFVIWKWVPAVNLAHRAGGGIPGTWRDMFADRVYVMTLGLLFVVIIGYSQLQVNIPAFLHREADISEAAIGVLFTVKTLVILGIQLPIAAQVNRGVIGRLLSYACLFFAGGLIAVTFTPSVGIPAAVLLFVLFTLGEVLFAPITSIIPVRLAPDHLRGRYFAVQSIVWGAAWGIASFAAGVALDSPNPLVLWPILAVAMLGSAAWSWRMRSVARLAP